MNRLTRLSAFILATLASALLVIVPVLSTFMQNVRKPIPIYRDVGAFFVQQDPQVPLHDFGDNDANAGP